MDGCNVEQDPVEPRRVEEKYEAVLRRGETVQTDVEQDPVESSSVEERKDSRDSGESPLETCWTDRRAGSIRVEHCRGEERQ